MGSAYGGSRPLQERAGFVWVVTAVAAMIAFGLVLLLLRVVFPSSGSSADDGSFPTSGSTSSTVATGGSLAVSFTENPALCSGADRSIGRITGAQPGEIIEIRTVAAPATGNSSGNSTGTDSGEAGMVGGPDRVADINGEYVIRWSCPPADAGRSWEVEATGRISRRTVGFLITGTDVDPAGGADLTVELLSESFRCDGETRRLGTISGAEPGETIGFRSDQAEQIRSGTADGAGTLAINWNCDAEEASIIWTVIATGEQSGRSASFTFSGSTTGSTDGPVSTSSTTSTTVATTEPDDLAITFTERPFRCDGQARAFATLTGLTPGETVAFTSPDSGNLRSGEADGDGRLAVRWQCDGADVGRSWRVTATGATSQRTITFTIDGAEPA